MAEDSEEMFVCGDDFDAILAILEEDEAIDHLLTLVSLSMKLETTFLVQKTFASFILEAASII